MSSDVTILQAPDVAMERFCLEADDDDHGP